MVNTREIYVEQYAQQQGGPTEMTIHPTPPMVHIIEVSPQRDLNYHAEDLRNIQTATAHPVGEPFSVPIAHQQGTIPQATAVATAVVHATAIAHSPDHYYPPTYSSDHYISPHRADLVQIFRVARAIRLVSVIDMLFLSINAIHFPYLYMCVVLPLCGYQSGRSYNKVCPFVTLFLLRLAISYFRLHVVSL
jgi:hypothetical protein